MNLPPLEVLFEDNHCLAIAKPPGFLSTHYSGREETLDRLVKRYLKQKHSKPGNVFLGIVHRLDRLVSGVLLFARTSKAAARLAAQFRDGTVEKVYWAVVEGCLEQSAGTLEDWLRKDEESRSVERAKPGTPGSRHCVLHFQRRGQDKRLTLLEIRPRTGRTHQIRVQFAQRGFPIFGDKKYGAAQALDRAIALHARALTFSHPTRGERITLTAELPEKWKNQFSNLFREDSK